MDDMLLENRNENEDITSLSHHLESEVKVNVNMQSLMKSEFINDFDPELIDENINDNTFLNIQRRRAETKLIKSKIIYKLHNDQKLSN